MLRRMKAAEVRENLVVLVVIIFMSLCVVFRDAEAVEDYSISGAVTPAAVPNGDYTEISGDLLLSNAGRVCFGTNDCQSSSATVRSVGTTSPLTGGTITGSGTIGISQASAAADGYLSKDDWTAFNSKGGGTVTSVGLSGGATGLTVTGSPINSSGTLTLGGTLNVANGGTGLSTVSVGSYLQGNGAGAFVARMPAQVKTDLVLVKGDVGLGNVENTALSTWAGSSNITTLGTITTGTVPVARVSGLATVATTGNAIDLSAGTLPAARMPALTGDVTTTAGTTSTTVGKLQSVAVSATAPTSGQVLTYNGAAWAPATASGSASPTIVYSGGTNEAKNGGVYYYSANGQSSANTLNDTQLNLVPLTCTAKNLYVTVFHWQATDGGSYVVTLMLGNGGLPGATALTCTVTNSGSTNTVSTCIDTLHTVSISTGNYINIRVDGSTATYSANGPDMAWGFICQ